MAQRKSTVAKAYGFANFLVLGKRGVIVRKMMAGMDRKHYLDSISASASSMLGSG